AGGQHAVSEDRRVAGRAREFLVVVDRIEVARRAGVADEIGPREALDHEGRELGPLPGVHRQALAMNAACRRPISSGVRSSLWVATPQAWPKGSTMRPKRSPQNMSWGA